MWRGARCIPQGWHSAETELSWAAVFSIDLPNPIRLSMSDGSPS
jgi:hypothetical protein